MYKVVNFINAIKSMNLDIPALKGSIHSGIY